MRSKTVGAGRTFLDEARRAQIVDTAIEVIAEWGYANTSLVQIAERARTSKSVVLYHFHGKNELIAQVVAKIFAVAIAEVRQKVQAEPTATGKLRALIEARVGFLSTHRAHMQTLLDIWISYQGPDGRMVLDSDTAEPIWSRSRSCWPAASGAGSSGTSRPARWPSPSARPSTARSCSSSTSPASTSTGSPGNS